MKSGKLLTDRLSWDDDIEFFNSLSEEAQQKISTLADWFDAQGIDGALAGYWAVAAFKFIAPIPSTCPTCGKGRYENSACDNAFHLLPLDTLETKEPTPEEEKAEAMRLLTDPVTEKQMRDNKALLDALDAPKASTRREENDDAPQA